MDCILVLAGGNQTKENIDSLPIYVKQRLDDCYNFYHKFDNNCKIILSSAGTPHRLPFINSNGYHVFECDSMSRYLIEKYKINPDNIYREYISYDTIGNAFFSKHNFIDPMDIKKFIVITSQFHMKRTKFIFNWIFDSKYNILFHASNNKNIDQNILKIRMKKEEDSIIQLKKNIQKYNLYDSKSIYHWLYKYHNAYSTKGVIQHKSIKNKSIDMLY